MRQKKRKYEPYGLRVRFALTLIVSTVICGLLFLVFYNAFDCFLTDYFEQSSFMETNIRKQGENLQQYISEKEISSKNLQLLKKWEKKQPLILLELYRDNECIYSSFYDIPGDEFSGNINTQEKDHIVTLRLTDTEVQAVLYSDFTYQYYVIGTAVSAVLSMFLFILIFLRSNQKLIRYICRLNEEVQILEGGNLEYQVSVEGNDEITDLAKSMNRMRKSFRQQMETEQALHHSNRQLVTEMSHDLRTPLTGMMLYLEILRAHRYQTEEELQDYLGKIDAKAQSMKQISDHLLEYSLIDRPAKQGTVKKMEDAFGNAVNNLCDDLRARGFAVVSEIEWLPCFVDVNDEFINRIFDNIESNAAKYAEPSADISICTLETDRFCGFSVMNTCANCDNQMDSSGIGVNSIRTMMKQMNGICTVEQTETVYEITLLFPKLQPDD